jgi:hypothetical protein
LYKVRSQGLGSGFDGAGCESSCSC